MPRARIGEIEVNYEEYGEGPPLLMILGLGQDIQTWGLQTEAFSEHFRLILFDNRDSGKSSRCASEYTTETMALDAIGLMDYGQKPPVIRLLEQVLFWVLLNISMILILIPNMTSSFCLPRVRNVVIVVLGSSAIVILKMSIILIVLF